MENETSSIPHLISINEIRNISIDYKEVLLLLQQLTNAPMMEKTKYFDIINKLSHNQFIFTITNNNKVIGIISLLIEQKLIHNGGKVGHIEDLVIDKLHQKKGYASQLIQHAVAVAKLHKCYKCILNCNDDVKPLYEKNGFTRKTNGMAIYF